MMTNKIEGMFGDEDDKLERKIPDIHIYRIENQYEKYSRIIQIVCGWFYDEEFKLPVYLYYDFESSQKKTLRVGLQTYVESESFSGRIFDLEKFKFKIDMRRTKKKNKTYPFEVYVQSLMTEYMLESDRYDEKISKNRKIFLGQYIGKPFDLDKSVSDEDIKEWIINMRDKHGQKLMDGFITYYIIHNISVPITDDGKFLSWRLKKPFRKILDELKN